MESREKVIRLFQYIAELNKMRSKNVTDFNASNSYEWKLFLSDIPESPKWISLSYKDVEGEDASDVILSVRKPDLPICPAPADILKDWLHRGYDDALFQGELLIMKKPKSDRPDETEFEYFGDVPERAVAFNSWLAKRNVWVEQYKDLKKVQDFFILLYGRFAQLEQMSDSIELVVSNGFLHDKNNTLFNHTILSRKVKIKFLQDDNTIQIQDVDDGAELYESFIRSMGDVFLGHFQDFKKELETKDIHPLDRKGSEDFLKRLVASLCPDSRFIEEASPDLAAYKNRLLLYMNPVFYIRKKQDGVLNAVNTILDDLENGGKVPAYLEEIVSGGMTEKVEVSHEQTLEEMLASVGGEDIDILLSKEANNEQLEIAQRIEKFNAVLVQGPPGTGKTHTIANLLGHFLAQGKKVLVTSHTKKALSVLKEKVVPNLQSLCVSVLDDSREDMERSVNGITEYMSRNDSIGLKKDMDRIGLERKQVIKDLGEVRKRIFGLIQKECSSIDIYGEHLSPSQAASFVVDNAEKLSYIPGKVTLYAPMPLSYDELRELYATNKDITKQEEYEFSLELPSLGDIPQPETYGTQLQTQQQESKILKQLEEKFNCKVNRILGSKSIVISKSDRFEEIRLDNPNIDALESVKKACSILKSMKKWQVAAAVDGKNGGALGERWNVLIQQIKLVDEKCEAYVGSSFGKIIEFKDKDADLKPIVDKMLPIYKEKGRISKFTRFFNKDFEIVFSGVTIDGRPFDSAEDCELLYQYLEYKQELGKCNAFWHNLIAVHGEEPELIELGSEYPIKVALSLIPTIKTFLAWNEQCLLPLSKAMETAGLPFSIFVDANAYFNKEYVDNVLDAAKVIDSVADALIAATRLSDTELSIQKVKSTLEQNSRACSTTCKNLIMAVDASNAEMYARAYEDLRFVLGKNDILQKRKNLLSKMDGYAPDWADAIRRREGIHGENVVPATIVDAWKWKQCSQIIEGIIEEPFDVLQQKSMKLSKMYREITAEYAEKCAWYHLLQETECNIDLKQALIGWKQIAKKIGKGTGKNAPRYRAEARRLMTKCQSAVPVWIMPMSKVFESLVPGKNVFDIIIVDEASQADISALAMVYMAKKAIIVGDDQQVSPMAIGVDIEQSNNLLDMYLKNVIPNYNLYDMKGSIYDIANTTFHPLMLREHFRCVPEIIGFSNALSYDCKIKPMRDGSDNKLLPAVVNYHVENGKRVSKYNVEEAITIVALLKSCMMQEEYADKTFGVISLLGSEQIKKLQSFLFKYIEPRDLEKHRVLCGDAANFQGDERDVIFLTLVDSPNENGGPIRITTEGTDDSMKKRYNVAASRARNQMWVVHSLDSANDLKPGDMRKRLIDYAQNPTTLTNQINEAEKKSESPFEEMVAKSLISLGYNITMQYPVGAYRLDMVVRYGKQNVALECDGERYHSGEDKIREDMERQAILERIGWRFIRVRGSEYFHNHAKAMNRIVSELNAFGIYPEQKDNGMELPATELYDRVRTQAALFLNEWKGRGLEGFDMKSIKDALGRNNVFVNARY